MAIIDTTPPAIVSISPANQASNVSTVSPIRVSFESIYEKNIKAGSGGIVISNGQGDTRRIAIHDRSQVSFYNDWEYAAHCYGYAYSVKCNDADHTLTITPHERLLSNSSYYVLVDEGAIISDSGIPLVTNNASYSFTTSTDATAPIPLSAEYTLKDRLSTITATFNEPIAGPITITPSEPTALVAVTDRQGDTRKMRVSIKGNQVELSAVNLLLPNTTYFLTMASGVIRDLAGNPFAGVPDTSAFSFNSGDVNSGNDSSREPVPIESSLRLGIGEDISVRYQLDKNVIYYFEDFKRGAGNITLSDGRGDTRKIAVGDRSQVSLNDSVPGNCFYYRRCDSETGSVLTINPLENLLPNSQYTLQIDPGAVTNFSGKPSAGTAKPIIIETGQADTTPIKARVYDTLPAVDGKLPIIRADFNKKIRAGAGNITLSNGEGDTQIIAANDNNLVKIVNLEGSKGQPYAKLSVQPSKPLLSGSRYFVLADSGAFTDLSGNPVAGVQDPNAITFTTAPLKRVEEINRGSVGQYEDKDVLVFHFDAPVKDYHSFHLNNGHTFGGNDVLLSPDGLSASVELTATSTIAPGDVLTITLREGITDVQFKL